MLWRLKKFFRSRMAPMEPQLAMQWKSRLATGYAFLGWNLLGFTVYMFIKLNSPKTGDSVDYAKLLGIKEATVMRYSGFQKVDQYDIKLSDAEIEEYHNITKENKKVVDNNDQQEAEVVGK